MKNKLFLCICVLFCAFLVSCNDSEEDILSARIHVTVKENATHIKDEKVYMFKSNHAPESAFFKPFYATADAVTDSYGEATFDVNFSPDDGLFYFGVFDGNNCIRYISVRVDDGETISVELNLGIEHNGYYAIKSVVTQTLMTVHSVNYTGDANNRSFITVQLPRNTERWFYAVSSNSSQNVLPTLKLYDGLSHYLNEQEGIMSDVISSLYVPAGNADCNIFFIKDNSNLDIFCDKSASYEYFTEGTRMNINSGLVDVNVFASDGATWYLGIENPAPDNDIYITIEVCALVWIEY